MTIERNNKRCRKCSRDLPGERFSICKRNSDGLQGDCKECVSAYMKRRSIEKKEKLNEKAREYYWANRDERLEAVREYRQENIDLIRARSRESHQRHRDERLAKQREYASRPEIKDRSKAASRAYYLAHKADSLKKAKAYRQSDRGRAVAKAAHAREKRIHAQKIKARYTVSNALANGNISRPTACQRCGISGAVEAHHHKGYERKHWLSVRWLCLNCHKIEDRKQSKWTPSISFRTAKEIRSQRAMR